MEPSDAAEAGRIGWWGRMRAAGLLVALLTAVGATTALLIGVMALGAITLLDRALG